MGRRPWRAPLAVALMLGLLGSCSAPSPSTPSSSPSSSTPAAPSLSPSASPSPTPSAVPLDQVQIALEPWADGFADPVFLTARPGDDRVYVVEQVGRVVSLNPDGTGRRTVLDITGRVNASGGERGLLSIAFDPAKPSRMFVDYTGSGGATVIEEYTFPIAQAEAGPNPIQTILTVAQPFANHNGGQLAFGPDGRLFIGLGDGGSGGDPLGNGQNRSTLLGSILRLDVFARRGYDIPPSNPFAHGGGAPEIWVYGLRNPWRFSFDGNDVYIADVGQNRMEEIDLVTSNRAAGTNFGWRTMEGNVCYPSGAACSGADYGFDDPIYAYPHSDGRCSVTGGYVYRGEAYPSLQGIYFFSDYCTGEILGLRTSGGIATETRNFGLRAGNVSSFGVDGEGNLFVLTLGGSISRVTSG